MRPDELARAAEERGFVSLYVPEHTHIPVSQRTPAPTGDAVLPGGGVVEKQVALLAGAA